MRKAIQGAMVALSLAATGTAAGTAHAQATLKQVASFPHQVTGVAVAPGGRIFVDFPRWTDDAPVVADKRLRWPDTMSEGPGDTIYVTASHIQDTSWFKPGAPPSLRTELFSFKLGGR